MKNSPDYHEGYIDGLLNRPRHWILPETPAYSVGYEHGKESARGVLSDNQKKEAA